MVEDFNTYDLQRSLEVQQTPDAFWVITECVEDAAGQVVLRAFGALTDMLNLFCDFAQYAEQTSSHVDVPKFLHQAGLRVLQASNKR